ncbi:hypothetical protein [Streptomyces sp. NPDC058297]|uniref:hypothetical protein n=1 Tax=Streptomyces sp. NPDC058297 TaxID=3346433 RepID=UPI0036EE14CF
MPKMTSRDAVFSSGTVDLDGAEFLGGTVDFRNAEFSGGTVDISEEHISDATVLEDSFEDPPAGLVLSPDFGSAPPP